MARRMMATATVPLWRRRMPCLFVFHLTTATVLTFTLLCILFSDLLYLAPCVLSGEESCYHGYRSRYSFDVADADHASWMKFIPDDVNLTSLSIPGTHDTLTFDIQSPHFQCQNHNLTSQLRAGIRYLDVRGRLRDNAIQIYHGSKYTGHSYESVLLTVFDFLAAHPSEVIIMRLKEEGRPYGTTNITFEEAFNYYLHNSSVTSPGARKHFYQPGSDSSSGGGGGGGGAFIPLPTLSALRGKILLLQNFPTDKKKRELREVREAEVGEGVAPREEAVAGEDAKGPPYGIVWGSDDIVLEDLWIIPSVEHLYMKWEAIQKALVRAAAASDADERLYLSHLSATVGVLPIEAAAGPLNGTVEGMNDRTGRWLVGKKGLGKRHDDDEDEEEEEDDEMDGWEGVEAKGGKTGVVIMDFPGKELVEAVLKRNEKLKG